MQKSKKDQNKKVPEITSSFSSQEEPQPRFNNSFPCTVKWQIYSDKTHAQDKEISQNILRFQFSLGQFCH